jgi:hypothetical protein
LLRRRDLGQAKVLEGAAQRHAPRILAGPPETRRATAPACPYRSRPRHRRRRPIRTVFSASPAPALRSRFCQTVVLECHGRKRPRAAAPAGRSGLFAQRLRFAGRRVSCRFGRAAAPWRAVSDPYSTAMVAAQPRKSHIGSSTGATEQSPKPVSRNRSASETTTLSDLGVTRNQSARGKVGQDATADRDA